jgi:hypothetical protein
MAGFRLSSMFFLAVAKMAIVSPFCKIGGVIIGVVA